MVSKVVVIDYITIGLAFLELGKVLSWHAL